MPNWNTSQQEVLDSLSENRNILVSAAAGSGKTAVLVERIIRTIVQDKADIDEILVVTFTKAAAAQMKGKIIKNIEDMTASDKDGKMARQLSLAEGADIMTIDSFCNKIVRENFSLADMDPAFEIYDSEEIKLLQEDILDEVLDQFYKESEILRELSDFVVQKNIDDSFIKDKILKVHRVADSFADPNSWLEAASDLKWVNDYLHYLQENAQQAISVFERRRVQYEVEQAPEFVKTSEKLVSMYDKDILMMKGILECDSLQKVKAVLESKWSNFPKKQVTETFGLDKYAELTGERDAIKGLFKNVYSEGDILEGNSVSSKYINLIIDIVRAFRERLLQEKKKLKKYEFSDVAHAAYGILRNLETGEITTVGQHLANQYKYIYIDEYQDSSDLQENILTAISQKDEEGYPTNIFMVGDVKQSIYRFRLARPELFTEKVGSYGKDEHGRLITLNMNYRSRREILAATNAIFEPIMLKSFGGIEYDDDAALHTPAESDYMRNYPEADISGAGGKAQFLMINTEDREDEEAEVTLTKDELEAVEIGKMIKLLVEGDEANGIAPAMVVNEEFNETKPASQWNSRYRQARYGDIVILQRAIKGSTAMVKIYEQMGIPVQLEDPNGYFDALEIVTMLSVLRIIDNIQQDIPLASVLLSKIGGMDESELALVVSLAADPKASLADKCRLFADGYRESDDVNEKLTAEKLCIVFGLLDKWSQLRPYISIADLVDMILADTAYNDFVAAMPDGKRRVANLKMLRLRAQRFESVRNAGLIDFLRYIDKCRVHDIDFGEASVATDVGNSVRVMSIHKSKGLEFPIVFASRLGKKFMLRDMSDKIIVDSDYHLAMDNLYKSASGFMVKTDSIKKDIIKCLNNKAVKTEEARLLYVAMTRAKERLIMTGTYDGQVPAIPLLCKSMMDYIRYAASKNDITSKIEILETNKYAVADSFHKMYAKKDLDYKEDYETILKDISSRLEQGIEETDDNPYEFIYPYLSSTTRKAKLSVSDIKHAEMEKHNNDSQDEYQDGTVSVDTVNITANNAAQRGTVTHAIFEHIDYGNVSSREELEAEMRRVLQMDIFTDEDRELVSIKFLSKFYSEDEQSVFMRMKKAAALGRLCREQQFIAGLLPSELPGQLPDGVTDKGAEEDRVIIQGIIDAFFYEGEENDIILVDYKTDKVSDGEELLGRYASQMYLYALTLEKLTGCRVADCILYSTRFGEVHYPEWREYIDKRH